MSGLPAFLAFTHQHKQTKTNSCVPCAVEFILKRYKIFEPNETRLQDMVALESYGWNEAKKELLSHGIVSEVEELCLEGLRERAIVEFSRGTPLVYSWPVNITFDPNAEVPGRVTAHHMHAALFVSGEMKF
jgi:hypothetical protein